ncbi:MAG TPA: CapA family protein [Symbiobacteriaceae bacterium]|nr:CapA family protein [Symbiobacteriaceae bacterium]
MRKSWAWLVVGVLLFSGCASQETKKEQPVVVAVAPGLPRPAVSGVTWLESDSPVELVRSGKAEFALAGQVVPPELQGFAFAYDETVLVQPYLDPSLSFSAQDAVNVLSGGTLGGAKPVRLSDLQVGWRPVPVSNVVPTPEALATGQYGVGTRFTAFIYKDGANPTVVEQFRALAAKPPEPWITLTVAGDFMLARGVARAMRENGTLYPVAAVKEHLSKADLTFVNLESPIGVKGTALPGKQIWFRAPPEAMENLKATGVDGVTVANNHILDYDTENFLETLDSLKQAGIKYVGGGRNISEARKPMVLEAKGVKIAFLGYSQFADLFFDWNYPRSFSATDTLPGVPRIQEDWLAEDIKAAKALAPIVAVAYHWGDEFQNYPNDEQKRLAHKTVDLGADLVLGYHPHAIQGFEIYNGKFIAYSTGNFIMDRQDTDLARESMILDFTLSPGKVRAVNVLPVWIKAEQPYIMTGAEGETLLQKMRTISGWKNRQ